MTFGTIEEAIAAIRRGEFVVVVDDADRENEGDLIFAAEAATPERLAFMVKHTSGLICVPMLGRRLDELRLPLMVVDNTDSHRTAFTVSVDVMTGTSTGISAGDRAATIQALIAQDTLPTDLARPGHVFPLRYHEGGVLRRAGHTEAAVDLAILADRYPAGVLCEIVSGDGSMARLPELEAFATEHDIVMVTIADLIAYRRRIEPLVQRGAEARVPTAHGEFRGVGFESSLDGSQHLALVLGDVEGVEDVLVRVHSECVTGDVFRSLRCDCGLQLDTAMTRIGEEGRGVVVYLRDHEGRGIGLAQKLAAYRLQDNGHDTVEANLALGLPADGRDYGAGAQILSDLGVKSVRLMTNNPTKVAGLEAFGMTVTERIDLRTEPTAENSEYLRTKAFKLGHLLGDVDG